MPNLSTPLGPEVNREPEVPRPESPPAIRPEHPRDRLCGATERAFEACYRLGMLFECVRVWNEDGEDDYAREEGLWLLDVLEGRSHDNKPHVADPEALWQEVRGCLDPTKSERASSLPDLPQFANAVARGDRVRRKADDFAHKAAIFAARRLLDDLAECRRPPADGPAVVGQESPGAEANYDWTAVCSRLGNCGGGHFEELRRRVAAESRAAADRLVELETARSSSTPPQPATPAGAREEPAAPVEPTEDGGGGGSMQCMPRPAGPEPGTRNFWYGEPRRLFVMPEGKPAALICLVWGSANRQVDTATVEDRIWREGNFERGFPSARSRCNGFFDSNGLPYRMTKPRYQGIVRIDDNPQNAPATG